MSESQKRSADLNTHANQAAPSKKSKTHHVVHRVGADTASTGKSSCRLDGCHQKLETGELRMYLWHRRKGHQAIEGQYHPHCLIKVPGIKLDATEVTGLEKLRDTDRNTILRLISDANSINFVDLSHQYEEKKKKGGASKKAAKGESDQRNPKQQIAA